MDILKKKFFLKQPIGFKNEEFPDHLCRLDKALYVLKHAPRTWYDMLVRYLLSSGYK